MARLLIRRAGLDDAAAVAEMAVRLHEIARLPGRIDRGMSERFVARLVTGAGTVSVVESGGRVRGFLAASQGFSPVSPDRVAYEHGWYSEIPGYGRALLERFEADNAGCTLRMSQPYGDERSARVLREAGYRPVETAWVK